jgi:predicted ATPase/DNA-binding SARP family transcriptional activator
MLEFAILGPLELRRDGRPVGVGGAKVRATLAVLLLHANEPVSAEALAGLLWGEDAPGGAARTVQVHISRLRKALGEEGVLLTTGAGYQLSVRADALDAMRFTQLIDEGRRAADDGQHDRAADLLREALALWRGAPLADLAYEPFAQAEIARLEEQRLAALQARIDTDLALGKHAHVIGELQRLTSEHPLREGLHAQLMLALYRSGRQAEALEAYRKARATLVEGLGIEPGEELRAMERAVLAQDAALAAPTAPAHRASTLPPSPTVLIERDAELAHLTQLLRAGSTRLVTVVGPGGVGKTRLALEAAHRLAGRFGGGAKAAWLAGVPHSDGVALALAAALGVHPIADETAENALAREIDDDELLLLADNFEHVLASASLIATLLERCPGLTVLATSREPLRLRAEQRFPLRPLETNAAALLFRQRARASHPDLSFDADDAAAITAICDRLDGLPLAVELAAGRVGLLTPSELATRLADALPLLAEGPRDLAAHQQTMTATLDWSYELLSAEEQQAFVALGAFTGGASLAAAEAVTEARVGALDGLVTRNLAHVRDGRVEVLEVVRQYAAHRLSASADELAVRRRHARWYCDLALRHARDVLIRRGDVTRGLAHEDGNFASAIEWSIGRGEAELAMDLVWALGPYVATTARREDGLRWADAALALDGDVTPGVRGRALVARAKLRGRDPGARAADATLALADLGRDADLLARCRALQLLSVAASEDCDWERARTAAAHAHDVALQLGDPYEIGCALACAALAVDDYGSARELAGLAVAKWRSVGALGDIAELRSPLGFHALRRGDYRGADREFSEALEVCQAVDDPFPRCLALGNLALVRLFEGRLEQAATDFADQLLLAAEHRFTHFYWEALVGLAAIAATGGDPERAALLSGAAEAWQLEFKPVEAPIYDRLDKQFLAPARDALGARQWQHARADGLARARQGPLALLDRAAASQTARPRVAPSLPAR